jgi:hypothetical protein
MPSGYNRSIEMTMKENELTKHVKMAKVDMSRNGEKLTREVDMRVGNNTIRKVVMIESEKLINEVI